MEARFENLDELSTKKFYLQYRFPPSSVGEVQYGAFILFYLLYLHGLFVWGSVNVCMLCVCVCVCTSAYVSV